MKKLLNPTQAFVVLAVATTISLIGCAMRPASPRSALTKPSASLAPLPEAVTSFGAVSHDGWLYVCGGHRGERHDYSADEVSGAFHRLHLADGRVWERLPGAEPAQGAPLVASGGYVYRVGGMAAQNRRGEKQNLLSKSLVTRFDPHRGRWEELAPLPAARSSHDAAIVGNKLYVGGGWQLNGGTNKSTWHESLLILELTKAGAQWQSIPQPFKRRGLAVAALGDRLYFLGGMDASNKTSQAVDIYDTKSGAWSQGPELPPGPMKGFGSSAIAQNGRLYWSGMKGDLYQLSTRGDAWELVGKLSHARFFHRLVPAGSAQLIAAGGEDSEGKRKDLELLTPSPRPLVAGQSANPANQHANAQAH